MRILVTGATGFVGRAVCGGLVGRGHDVSAVVRLQGTSPLGTAEICAGDFTQVADWSGYTRGHDAVLHLAARVHVMHETATDPEREFMRSNRDLTTSIAEAAAGTEVGRFLLLSSIKATGEGGTNAPYTAHSPSQPLDPYGRSKLAAEAEVERIVATSSMHGASVRIPLVYGPEAGGNFARLLKLVRSGIPLPLGAVKNARTMIAQNNLTDVLIYLLEMDRTPRYQRVLAADEESLSTPELIRAIAAGMNRPARLLPVPVGSLRALGKAAGRASEVDRLVDSLVVQTSSTNKGFGWVAPIGAVEAISSAARAWHNQEVFS